MGRTLHLMSQVCCRPSPVRKLTIGQLCASLSFRKLITVDGTDDQSACGCSSQITMQVTCTSMFGGGSPCTCIPFSHPVVFLPSRTLSSISRSCLHSTNRDECFVVHRLCRRPCYPRARARPTRSVGRCAGGGASSVSGAMFSLTKD